MRLPYILNLIAVFFVCQIVHGQQQFILNTEVGGKAFVFGSMSLESYWEKAQVGIGLGAGFNSFSTSNQLILDSTSNEFRDFLISEYKIPVTAYVYKTFGKGKNKVTLPLGYTSRLDFVNSGFEGEQSIMLENIEPLPFAGLGYELQGDRVIFRLTAYALYLGEDSNNIFPDILPWLGLGFGFRLGKKSLQ